MSVRDPKGYYACLGLSPGATAGDIRAAFHRCAKQCHPDIHSGPYAKVRFQAINEAYRTLSNPGQRATYDGSLPVARPERFETRLYQFGEWRTELDSLALRKMRFALLLCLGVLGGIAVLLHLSGAGGPEETSPALSSPLAATSTLKADTSLTLLAPPSVQVHPVTAPPPSSGPPSVPPRTAPSENLPLSGAWLFRDLPNSKSPLSLLAREEAAEIQRQL